MCVCFAYGYINTFTINTKAIIIKPSRKATSFSYWDIWLSELGLLVENL